MSYNVRLSWGDPREPEPYPYAIYTEGKQWIHFNIELSDFDDVWLVKPPKNLRSLLKSSWKDRKIIYARVLNYLSSVETSTSTGAKIKRYNKLKLDESSLESYVVYLKKKIDSKTTRIRFSLPTKKTLPPLLIGFSLVFISHQYNLSNFMLKATIVLLITSGFYAVGELLKGVQKDYETLLMPFSVSVLTKRMDAKKAKWSAMKLALRHFWRRYLLVLASSIYIIYHGVSLA